jgi:hypothetical protein
MGFNNFMRFLKEYQLVDTGNSKGNRAAIGIITHFKTGAIMEYRKIGSERAQLVFK